MSAGPGPAGATRAGAPGAPARTRIPARRWLFVAASLALLGVLVAFGRDGEGSAFLRALIANLAVVAWSSFVLPLRGLPRFEPYFQLRRWERSGRLYRALGVPIFRALVRRGPLSRFNRALPSAWHSGEAALIERETRAAEAGHGIAFCIVLALALLALTRGETARAVWLFVLDIPMNLYPVLLQRDHRIRLARQIEHGGLEHHPPPDGPGMPRPGPADLSAFRPPLSRA